MKPLWWAVGCSFVGAILVVGSLLALPFLVKHYRIPQDGMHPSLPAGASFLAERRPYADISEVHRGDVVVWHRYRDGLRYSMVWRVVGLPGDTVELRDTELVINGEPVPRRPIGEEGNLAVFEEVLGRGRYRVAYDRTATREDALFEVPADHLLLLGDNRDHAHDGRYTGFVPFEAIKGRVIWRFSVPGLSG